MRRVMASMVVVLVLFVSAVPTWGQYQNVAARVDPAVVLIVVDKPGIGSGCGSGFFIDPNGYILTAKHMVDGASNILVRSSDGAEHQAQVVTYSDSADAALIKIDGSGFQYLDTAGLDEPEQGQEVLVFGYPLCGSAKEMQAGVTLTRGIVSAVRPGALQIDAAVTNGNSGGPVVATNGDVLGILVAGYKGAPGINFAVDLRSIRAMVTPPFPTTTTAAPPASASEYPLNGSWRGLFQVMGARNNAGNPCCPAPQLPQYTATLDLTQDGTQVSGSISGGINTSVSGSFNSDTGNFTLASTTSSATFDGGLRQDGTIVGSFTIPGKYHFGGTGIVGLIGAVGMQITMWGNWVAHKN